jgi:transcriptional regulator with XRE-family HTH domain
MLQTNMELTERKLKAARVLYGFKQSELAKAVGRSQAWLSLVESGKIIPQNTEYCKLEHILQGKGTAQKA